MDTLLSIPVRHVFPTIHMGEVLSRLLATRHETHYLFDRPILIFL